MTRIEHSAVIERPIEEVFAFVEEARNDPLWYPSIVEVRQERPGPARLGDELTEVVHFLGRRVEITWVVVEHEPPRRSAIEARRGPVPVRGRYDLEPVDGGTRLTISCVTDAHGFFRIAEPVFARMARRALETSLGNLKDLLEAGVPAATAAA